MNSVNEKINQKLRGRQSTTVLAGENSIGMQMSVWMRQQANKGIFIEKQLDAQTEASKQELPAVNADKKGES